MSGSAMHATKKYRHSESQLHVKVYCHYRYLRYKRQDSQHIGVSSHYIFDFREGHSNTCRMNVLPKKNTNKIDFYHFCLLKLA